MPRQPFGPIRQRLTGGSLDVGTRSIRQRPELEAIIGNCLMAWPPAEAEMALLLGHLLGAQNAAALAVFQSLRRSSAQRDAISEAARVTLDETDQELLSAILNVHKSIETERNALCHGHFGTYSTLPDALLWMTTNDYVELKASLELANAVFDEARRARTYSRIYVYKKDDLDKIYEDVLEDGVMWHEFTRYLRSRPPQRAGLYRQLCDRPRIAQALVTLRREKTPPAQS